ncbi:c-type cytochrome [Atopomonas sediminilitoris]|uniref:c-type cytochrome n=1 Tax=Atopomonas sediminilitoris TaxID=2919919 RepID=UPI001F4E1BEC|nr:cytochrome c [Atopomonas sediminilitoris]MCJ8169450.1 cytochrome c [Atopomonas sediminilitoris]
MRKIVATLVVAGVAVSAAVLGVVYSGMINVGADDPHSDVVHRLLEVARERSVARRAADIVVPPLDDAALVVQGAGNYQAMCIGCHLAPGLAQTELNQALYPAPPNLALATSRRDPAQSFWIIKHGIKASGMPAWGKSMADEYIWGMVALMQRLPTLTPAEYQALVAQSAGHQHGGGESAMHDHTGSHHPQAEQDEHAGHAVAPTAEAPEPAQNPEQHIHPDGKLHQH